MCRKSASSVDTHQPSSTRREPGGAFQVDIPSPKGARTAGIDVHGSWTYSLFAAGGTRHVRELSED
jgi:hypothetical protein